MSRHGDRSRQGATLTTVPNVHDDLLEHLLQLDFHAYEQLIKQLLGLSGYTSVAIAGRTFKRGRTQSGGHDLKAISHTDLTASVTLAQIKQYRRVVSRRFVDELRGTMLRLGAEQGLLITTSTFSRVARRAAAESERAPITLLDGKTVANLLIEHGLGVSKSGQNLCVDEAFFDKLQKKYRSTYEQTRHGSTTRLSDNRTSTIPSEAETTSKSGDIEEVPAPENVIAPTDLNPSTALDLSINSTVNPIGGDMQWRTHILAGIGSLGLLDLAPAGITTHNLPFLVGLSAFGALLPDLDANESKIKHLTIARIQPFALPAQAIYHQFGHRGFFHSISALTLLAALSLPLAFHFGWQAWAALLLGYASHLAADACTRSGIPFIYIPLLHPSKKRYHLLPPKWRFVTGSEAEGALLPLLALLVLIFLLRHLPAAANFSGPSDSQDFSAGNVTGGR